MKHILAAALLIAGAPAAAQTIETGTGDWRNIPPLLQAGSSIDADTVTAIIEMGESGECTLSGRRGRNIDVDVAFVVQYNAQGSIDRLVLEPLGCPRADGVLAGAVLRLLRNGGFAPAGGRREGWFRGQVGFTNRGG
ncbi:MAG TPA: hypothetical protein VIT38_02405 [Allosphingosinicella sp.]